MKRSELNKLLRFVHRLKRESNGMAKRAAIESKVPDRDGSQTLALVAMLDGQSDGIYTAAESLRQLLDTFKIEGDA